MLFNCQASLIRLFKEHVLPMAKITKFLVPNMVLALLSAMEDRNNEHYDEVLYFLNMIRFSLPFLPSKMTSGIMHFTQPFGLAS